MPVSLAVTRRPSATRGELLERFLRAYWLRPENAFWMTLRSLELHNCPWESPSIDVCCGDGVFSFLHSGGEFDPDFDVFRTVDRLDRVRAEHADMFDHFDDGYDPQVAFPPGHIIDVGLDLKPSLLAKARLLRLYNKLVQHDTNQPLPFADDSFLTVYCNAAYWVERIEPFLRELCRITRPGGRVILQVKLERLKDYTLRQHGPVLGEGFLDIIGGGRHECWPSLACRRVWEQRFEGAGLDIESMTPFVTRTHAHIWDVGLRPIAPLLVRMANGLSAETRSTIKREWVALFSELLKPICHPTFDLFPDPSEPAEVQYVLTPR